MSGAWLRTQPSSSDYPPTVAIHTPVPGPELRARAQDDCLLASVSGQPQKADLPSYEAVNGSWEYFPREQSTLLRPQAQFQQSWAQRAAGGLLSQRTLTQLCPGTNGETVSALLGSKRPSALLSRCCLGKPFQGTVRDKNSSSGTPGPSHGSPVSSCWGENNAECNPSNAILCEASKRLPG